VGEQLFLTAYAAAGDSEQLFDFLEAALADPDSTRGTCEALDDASILSDVPRHHLKHGLEHLARQESQDAWPPLIIGLEGAFADVAIDQGIAVRVDNQVYLADANGNALPQKVPGVEGVAKGLGHAAGDSDFGDFLIRRVYAAKATLFGTAPLARACGTELFV